MYQNDLKVNGCAGSTTELARIKDALSFIDPDLPREDWWRILAGLKNELGEGGRDLAREWSQGGSSFKLSDFDDTWRSVKPGVGIGIGTVFFMAKEAGWTDTTPRPKLTAEQIKARRQAQERAAKEAKVKAEADQARAADQAARIWQKAQPADSNHPYLTRKQVAPTPTLRQIAAEDLGQILGYRPSCKHGVLNGSVLVAPARRVGSDDLSTVELIDEAGRKAALYGAGTKSRTCWATIHPMPTDLKELLIVEGPATGLSATQATGLPAVAALSASNLRGVAEDLRSIYPNTRITILADLDKKTGKAMPQAVEAAKAIDGFLAVPGFGPDRLESQTDFNDLHVMAGPEAVKACISGARQVEEKCAPLPRGYSLTSDGLFWTSEEDGKDPVTIRLGPWIQVLDLTRDAESQDWGLRLKWKDPDKIEHEHILTYSSLAASKALWVEDLAALGWLAESEKKARAALTRFFTTIKPQTRARTASTTGWSADLQAFVLPDVTIGSDSGEKIILKNRPRQNPYSTKGSLEGWQNSFGRWAEGNDFLIFAISLALAAPLAKILGAESGGIHFYNDSTAAKTTTLRAANSVWCGPHGLRQWRGSDNGLEGACSLYNDTLLCLDEIGQASQGVVGNVAYMIANEQSKNRMEKQCSLRDLKSWKILFLSSGEKTIANKMKEDGEKIKSGQEVRIVDIFCDAGEGLGAFQRLHEHQNPRDFAEALKSAAEQNYGHLGREWVQFLINNKNHEDYWGKRFRQIRDEFVKILKVQNGQCLRVMNRFALVAVAGELATEAGLVPWSPEDATNAAGALAERWLEARGGDGSGEDRRAVEAVLGFISKFGTSKFQDLDYAANFTEKIVERAGYKKKGPTGKIQYIFTRGQLQSLLGDIPFKQATQALASKGVLQTEGRHFAKKVSLPDNRERCYVIEVPDQEDTED